MAIVVLTTRDLRLGLPASDAGAPGASVASLADTGWSTCRFRRRRVNALTAPRPRGMVFDVMLHLTAEQSYRASDAPCLGAQASPLAAKRGIARSEEANTFAQPAHLW